MQHNTDNQKASASQNREIKWIESEHAWRIIDTDGSAFVANYSSLTTAKAALADMNKQKATVQPDNAPDIEKDTREPLPLSERVKKPAVQKWLKSEKRNRWIGNTICEVTAMEPRNVRSGYLGWDL